MSHSTAGAPAREAHPPGAGMVFRWPLALAVTAFLLLWVEIIQQLRSEWSINPQYSYGWTVPFLVGFLFYQRWLRRTPAALPRHPGLTIGLAFLAAAIFLPARLIAVANPDWRLLSWTLALVVVVISLCALDLAGGAPWLRHFAFPVLFFLVAVPWPVRFEQLVVQSLMRADTAITIQLLNLAGTLAVQHGNVIELSSGPVGIDDACTGVRSLQATFMIALFLGEFYRMKFGRRVVLGVAGALVAFLCNIGRTFLLCEVATNSGIEAIHRWHDPAGYTILLVCLFTLWGLSIWLKPRETSPSPSRSAAPTPVSSPALGVGLLISLILWIALTEIVVAAWYTPGGQQNASNTPWSVTWPTNELDYRQETVPAVAEGMLRYNEGGAASWRSADNRPWYLFSFRWLPGRTAALFVRNHRPDICLPASGRTLVEESEVQLLPINGVKLPIRFYRFNEGQRPLHVAYIYWDGRSAYDRDAAAAEEDWTVRGRLHAAWRGKREIGARMLELAVWGMPDDAEARRALRQELEKIVHPASR